MVFVIELKKWFDTQKDMMLAIMSDCYDRKGRGEYFRARSFFAQTSDGLNIKIIVRFDGGTLTAVETYKYERQVPNWLFPFMLTEAGKKKKRFFRDKAEMLQALQDSVNYTLCTTSETLLNKKGTIVFFKIKKNGTILIVDGVKHKLI